MESRILLFIVLLTTISIQIVDCEEAPAEECKYSSYEPRGTYESPGYPDGYPNEADCMYRIFTNTHINLNFESFSIEDTGDCSYDYLQVIFDATSQNPSQRRYCGDGLNRIEGGNLRGKGPAILIFRSDDSTTMPGFKFGFELELIGPDPCDSNPCQNEGTCARMVGYYLCECVEGYRGKSCEVDWDECAPQPCLNGGQCVDGPNSFTCECTNNYTGDLCEIDPDPCESAPCMNGGLCNNQVPYFICECPNSFSGELCDEPVPTIAPPTTTPAPTTITTTTVEAETTTAEALDDGYNSYGPGNGGPNGNGLDENDGDSTSGGSSGAIVAALLICLLLIALAALLLWYWSRNNGNMLNEMKKDFSLSKLKSNIQTAFNKKRSQFKPPKPNASTRQSGFANGQRRIPRDLIVEEIDPEDERRRNRKAKRNGKRNLDRHLQTNRQPENRNGIQRPYDGGGYGRERGFADENSVAPTKIDLSPEEAVAVLNQLLGYERNKDGANLKDIMLTNQRNTKPKRNETQNFETFEKSLPGSVSTDDGDSRTKRQKKSQRRRNSPRLRGDVNNEFDQTRKRVRQPTSPALTPEPSNITYEKTQDPADKVKDWLSSSKAKNAKNTKKASPSPNSISTIESTSKSSLSSSSSISSRKKANPVDDNMSIEEYDYNDDDYSTTVPSPEPANPRHQKPQDMQILPVTKNKAKSLVDKLVKAPVRSKQNFVGPRLGVKRENAFMD